MSNKSVAVLAPNGRRQNVKVTPNTTILQVLEEVCQKQGFKAEEYDIVHHNKVLDATSIMRYTGIPNNAQLEMVTALKVRAESSVKVGLALESGNRVMGEFQPSDSLWHVVKTLCPDESDVEEPTGIVPVIFYVGREEWGIENLKKIPLRSLGLTSGGAILRFFKKTPDELHHQANVSAPLSRPVLNQEPLDKPSTSATARTKSLSTEDPKATGSGAHHLSTSEVVNLMRKEELDHGSSSSHLEDVQAQSQIHRPNETRHEMMPDTAPKTAETSQSEDMEIDFVDSSQSITQSSSVQSTSTASQEINIGVEESGTLPEETIVFLGERNAVLFDVATAKACKPEDVPDDFFDLTVDDAKQLLRDLKRRQAALEEQPLVTSQYRELEKSKHMLNTLSQYKRCVVKVQFPNQLVLQGTFMPLEKVSHVIDFVRKYLQNSTIDFHLFITPPKKILNAEQTLYDAQCVPGALLHFSSPSDSPANGSYLREDIMNQISTAAAAAAAATASRKSKNLVSAPSSSQQASVSTELASASVLNDASASQPTIASRADGKKVPKWFKPTK